MATKTEDRLNVDNGAQGGDNEDQVTQEGRQMGGAAPSGLSAGPLRTGGVGSATAGLIPSDGGSGNAAGTVVGDNNAGAAFNASSVAGASDSAQDHDQADTKSDQTDYGVNVTNDDQLSSNVTSGRAGGARDAGSVENLTVSQGDVLRGAGASSGPATGGQSNVSDALRNGYSGNTGGDTDAQSVTAESGAGDVPSPPA